MKRRRTTGERINGLPVLLGRRQPQTAHLMVWCPHCKREHPHCGHHPDNPDCRYSGPGGEPCTCPRGTGEGSRGAHCDADSDSPYLESGYYVKEVPDGN
jgi:hypothetical protein